MLRAGIQQRNTCNPVRYGQEICKEISNPVRYILEISREISQQPVPASVMEMLASIMLKVKLSTEATIPNLEASSEAGLPNL